MPIGAVPPQFRQVEVLRRVGIFQLLSPLVINEVAKLLQPRDVPAATVVVREGDTGDALYLIESGTLVVETDAGGGARPVARLGPGEFFGETALLTGEPRSATVRAESASRLWVLPAQDFRRLVAAEPALDRAVADTAALRRADRAVQEFGVEHTNLATRLEQQAELTIGRHPDNDIVLGSRVVSGHHAVVRRTGDTFLLVDLGSSNGTYVNGAPIRKAELKDGDRIRIADQQLVFDRRDLQHVVEPRGIRIDAVGLRMEVKGGKNLLQDVDLSILPGELVAIVGGSGAGKSTLLDSLSGVRRATSGTVAYHGQDFYSQRVLYRHALGYVPQDDIIHRDLPVRRTLAYASELRLPLDTSPEDRAAAVDQALEALGLTARADLKVSRLSGGQRKRASIGVELLTQPRVFFLDEPTSGLDPATDTQMMELMRSLARSGSTVVLTTHATKNVGLCDKVVFMARGGYLAFFGPPADALQYFDVESFDQIYTKLEEEATPEEWAARFRDSGARSAAPAPPVDRGRPVTATRQGRVRRALRQFSVQSRRTTEVYLRNPSRFGPMLGPPLMFSLLLLALLGRGVFEADTPDPTGAVQILFLMAFAAFTFGLMYGLQEIVKEFAIFRRERLVDLGVVPYLLSKTTFLVPVLVVSTLLLVVIPWAGGRLPEMDAGIYGRLLVTLLLTNFAGLGFALLTSAMAKDSQAATDLLPIWFMPQVLFAGGIFPVSSMGSVGEAISVVTAVRWSFEGAGQATALHDLLVESASPIAQGLLLQYDTAFTGDIWQNWAVLAAFAVAPLVAAAIVLRARTRT